MTSSCCFSASYSIYPYGKGNERLETATIVGIVGGCLAAVAVAVVTVSVCLHQRSRNMASNGGNIQYAGYPVQSINPAIPGTYANQMPYAIPSSALYPTLVEQPRNG